VTYIDMGLFDEQVHSESIGKEPEERIKNCAAYLPYAAGLAGSRVVQGLPVDGQSSASTPNGVTTSLSKRTATELN
jgi:hypothetical protein